MPNPANIPVATLVGLINAPSADFNAFAPSPAAIPPSLIAVIYNAKSCTLPPKPLIIGPALGIASTKS